MTQETEHLAHYKICLLVLLFLLSSSINGQSFADSKVDSLLKSGITFIINQQYEKALADFRKLDVEYPIIPLGKIYLAACKIAEAFDLEIEYDSEFIEENLDEALTMAEELLDADGSNIWNNYYLALTEGYQSYYEAIKGNWLNAIPTGMNSINAYGICLSIDSTFYEAYIGIGTYEYWVSRNTEFLDGLPFYKDETQIGIRKLREAVEKSSYNSYLAINSLVWIYIDQQDYTAAIDLGKQAVVDFPSSRYFKWGLARAYEDVNPDTSIIIYNEILDSFLNDNPDNRINEVILKHLIAQQYFIIGEDERSLELCENILSITDFTDFEISRLEDRLERVNELRNKLIRQHR